MTRRTIQILMIGALAAAGCLALILTGSAGNRTAGPEAATIAIDAPRMAKAQKRESLAGKYLGSHFAQSVHDWQTANQYLGTILENDPANLELIRRSMILAMGAGDLKTAAQRARQLGELEKGDDLALLVMTVNTLANGNIDGTFKHLGNMRAGDMTDFVKPVLRGWAAAAQGNFDTEGFNDTSIHLYHGGLIAVFLDKMEEAGSYADSLLQAGTLSNSDAVRTADLLAALGRYEEAAVLYEGVYIQDETNRRVAGKLEEVRKEDGGKIKELAEPLLIETAQQGAARAMYDMAYILYQERSDSSTKIFARMALALDPQMTDAHLLLADTLARNGRLRDAIIQLGNVPEGHSSYLAVQRHMAELLAEVEREKETVEKLDTLFKEHNDVEALIRIGDLYRHQEDYKGALSAYNRAAKYIGGDVPEEYWYLLYARGMAYEREGDWTNAESDLKAAMVYRPNHPYLLNYLGYGWADQGLNLDESLELIKRAVALQPGDGYIIDSLGWVQYMMQDYEDALPNLERAVELLPYDSTINDHLGDVYWQVGRKTEARYQWERALNNAEEEDDGLKEKLEHKLRFGLDGMEEVRQAGAE